ncbi:ABC transporter permease [Actinopolymorpha sp. B17G11]|uniref:ABC transporter permease n=1 Tax=Actinopolymorpha sp. B17G11 TaxID=3160861 RepID=UPI0032E41964
MSTTGAPDTAGLASGRAVAWERRKAALTRFWRDYRRQRVGVAGLTGMVLIVVLALAAPLLTDESGLDVTQVTGERLEAPSARFLLGTDESGRSVLLLILWGARISLLVGVTATLLAMGIGTLVGIAAGHFGGWFAGLLMRITDWFIVLPRLVLAIALAAVLGPSLTTIIVAIGVTSWAGTARLIRAQTLAVEARPYLERARALGAGHWHQMTRHVLPNVMPLVLASTTLEVASAVLAEATLAFLGLGDPSRISWGGMLSRANSSGAITYGAWWYLLTPGLAILVVVLCFTLCGRALEAVFNPRLRGR